MMPVIGFADSRLQIATKYKNEAITKHPPPKAVCGLKKQNADNLQIVNCVFSLTTYNNIKGHCTQ